MRKVYVKTMFKLEFDEDNHELIGDFIDEMMYNVVSQTEGADVLDTTINDVFMNGDGVATIEMVIILNMDDGIKLSEVMNELDYNFEKDAGSPINLIDTSMEDYELLDSK